jgi:superfamily II DNA/RNA helicase
MQQTTFEELGVAPELAAALAERGIHRPFPIQALTIRDAMAGRDVCGKAKTGSGKTLAFGLPLLQVVSDAEPGRPKALVLVPTRELCIQVHDVLAPLGKVSGARLAIVYGGAPIEKQVRVLQEGAEIVVATPGRMIDLIDRKAVALDDIEHVVLDEADRMADMGFLPQVEWILRHTKGRNQTLLFSATLDGAVKVLVDRYQHDPVYHEVVSETVTVEQMVHRFISVHELDKVKVAAAICRSAHRTILFCRTKRTADRLAHGLRKEGVEGAAAIHGDLPQRVREQAMKGFTDGSVTALVATDVAARGLDIEDVEIVVHYDPPEDHKAYLHRSGRTARAGEAGLAVTLLLWNEELVIRRLQKRIGIDVPIVEMFSNDPRLADLASWDPVADPGPPPRRSVH